MKRYVIALAVGLLALSESRVEAQRFSLSTNLLDYACLGTMNIEGAYSVSRRWSLTIGADYNPFTFKAGQPEQFQLRQRSCSLGARLWPWHIWSGWWFAGKLRYQEYNEGGIISRKTEEGDRIGAGLYAGYTHMLSPHLNLEFGEGLWAGRDAFRRYDCPVCGQVIASGDRIFFRPDDVMISLAYVF